MKKEFNSPILQSANINQVTLENRRYYELEGGEKYTSVTTFLSKTKSEKDKKTLNDWRKRVGKDEADKVSKEATTFGKKLHRIFELFLLNKFSEDLFDGDDYLKERFIPIKEFLEEKVDVFLGSEIMVYSHTLQLAGSVDLVYKDKEGNVIVCDLKTSEKKKRIEWCEDYALQILIYSLMVHELFSLEINKGLILFSYSDTTHEPILFSPEKYFGTLHNRIKTFRNILREEKRLENQNYTDEVLTENEDN